MWTKKDEQQFKDIQNRRKVAIDRVAKLVISVSGSLGNEEDLDRMLDWMILHADEVRDALEPFDSGVREEPK